jgi:hypothetical protein
MTKYKIICEHEDYDQYIDANDFECPNDGSLYLYDEEGVMIAAFTKDFWKAIRIANDLLPCCEKCGSTMEENVTYQCENCEEMGED